MATQSSVLRLTHVTAGAGLVQIEFEEPRQARRTADVPFAFTVDERQQERLRWYYEDFLQYPADPAPQIAKDIETEARDLGVALFRAIFQASDDAQDLWAGVRDGLSRTRVEILASSLDGPALPWELIRDPKTDVPLAIGAQAFVRGYSSPAHKTEIPTVDTRPVRILLAICRPAGGQDVPFRSVASRLVKGLSATQQSAFTLDVLRPPTFARLAEVLRIASEKESYDIVHFDGHGGLEDVDGKSRAFVYFETSTPDPNHGRVDGQTLGALLTECRVPVLVLNACRSAQATPAAVPVADAPQDAHARIRALGSLALQVMDAGVAGVVAMQHNVYVITAAQLVADLYATLARGQTLGRAVSLGRKQLQAQPARPIPGVDLSLEDWPVPVVYEAAPLALFPLKASDTLARVELDPSSGVHATIDPALPRPPDVGFFGRDETLLAIDRAFDRQRIVLLHAFAGSGKTATAVEFARWYALTGGVQGPIMFTSFEQYTPLVRALETFAHAFGELLEHSGINWLTLSDSARRPLALQVLRQIPSLWIWDNVESVSGLTPGASPWTAEERGELASFLSDLRDTRASVLLTSRREETEWLGQLPVRIALEPMPLHECLQLAEALAGRSGGTLGPIGPWRPLLEFAAGNPLTTTVVVSEALRQGLRTPEAIEQFTLRLRQGEAELPDAPEEGRTRSLRASLSYGFNEAFAEDERAPLSLLHLFQGIVSADLLRAMGNLGADSVPELEGMTAKAAKSLLDRAAEIGQLKSFGLIYEIHPALPGFYRELFEAHFPGAAGLRATRAFCLSTVGLGDELKAMYEEDPKYARGLAAIEANLLHVYRIGRANDWDDVVIRALSDLRTLYEHQGRLVEFARLIDEVADRYVGPDEQPVTGREDGWYAVMQHRSRIAFARSDSSEALRLQAMVVKGQEQLAKVGLDKPENEVTDEEKQTIRGLSIALHELAIASWELRDPKAVALFTRAADLARRYSSDPADEAQALHGLGVVYAALDGVIDLDKAEATLQRALTLWPPEASLSRSRTYAELGFVRLKRAQAAQAAGDQDAGLAALLASISAYEDALELTPSDALQSLATKHLNLGVVYRRASEFVAENDARAQLRTASINHLQESIKLAEMTNDRLTAGMARANMARALAIDNSPDALLWVRRAEEDLEGLGAQAGDAQALLAKIREQLAVTR